MKMGTKTWGEKESKRMMKMMMKKKKMMMLMVRTRERRGRLHDGLS